MQNRFFFTALPVDLTEKVDPSAPLQGIKLVPGIHIPKEFKENLAKQKDEKYQEYLKAWLDEKDPDRKVEIGKAAKAYWAVRRKELGFLDEEDIKRLEEEKRKREKEEEKQREFARQQYIQRVKKKIARGIPAKHILYCDYPGLEFREEIDASEIGYSYKDDYDSYNDVLYDFIVDVLINLDFEKFLDIHYTEDDVSARGHFWFTDLRTMKYGDATIGGPDLPLNKNIKIYLQSVRKSGTVIETKQIDIKDYMDFAAEKETLLECGLWDATDEYIETSLRKFVKETGWHIGLEKGYDRIEDVAQWPAPNEDGKWIDADDAEMLPRLWYGYSDSEGALSEEEDSVWNIENGLAFWFSEEPWRYIVEFDYSGHAGCFGGDVPDIEAIRKRCPVLLEKDDTPESIEEKVQQYCLEKYRETHT